MKAPQPELTEEIIPEINLKNYIGLIDADYLLYRYAAANDKVDDLEEVLKDVEQRISSLEVELNCRAYIHILSGKKNFRNEIGYTKKYKGTRDPDNKPVWFAEVRAWYDETYKPLIAIGCEADDALIQMHFSDTVVISTDKDLLQSPGRHIIMRTKEIPGSEFPFFLNEVFITKEEGYRRLIIQSVLGDSVDGIQGLEKAGKVTVSKAFANQPIDKLSEIALGLYQDKLGLQEGLDRFVEMYSLVRMRTNMPDSYLNEKYDYLFKTLEMYRKYF